MLRLTNVALFAVMILMNYLANALPLNNVTTGQLSDSYPNLFVPAGLTFSIWGVIYLLLALFCALQFTAAGQVSASRIGWLFGISCILNALWIVCWHYRLVPLSLLLMLGLLVILILINRVLKEFPDVLPKAAFGIYLGWICIATIANVTALLVDSGWGGWSIPGEAWTIIMISAGAIIAAAAIYRFINPYIGLAVIWAFIGIAIKRQDDYRSIFIAALVAAVLVASITLWGFFRKSGA